MFKSCYKISTGIDVSYEIIALVKLGFPTGRNSATFQDNGTEVPSLSPDKGTTGQAKNLAKGQDRAGQSTSGMGRRTKWDRAENDILKQYKTGN